MRKLLFTTIGILLSSFLFAQEINTNYPFGKYKLGFFRTNINFYIGANNRWALTTFEAGLDEEEKLEFNQTKGTYIQQNDTLFFTLDQVAPLVECASNQEVESGKQRLTFEGFSTYYDLSIQVGKNFAINEAMDVSSLAASSEEEPLTVFVDKSDSLYIIFNSYSNASVFAYALPAESNDIVIHNFNDSDLKYFHKIKAVKGENNNEILLFIDEKKGQAMISFFYTTNSIEPELLEKDIFQPKESFSQIYNHRQFTVDDYIDFQTEPVTEPESDPFISYASYKEALKVAGKEKKFALLYYEPEEVCEYESLAYFKSKIIDYEQVENFNKLFVFYLINEKDKALLNKYDLLSEHPALVIINSDGNVVYKDNKCIDNSLMTQLYNYPDILKTGLDVHCLNTYYMPEMSKKKTPDEKQLRHYLEIVSAMNSQTYYGDLSNYFGSYENEEFKWKLEVDNEKTIEYLDIFIEKYALKKEADPKDVLMIQQLVKSLENTYPILSGNKLSPAFNYLAKACDSNELTSSERLDLMNLVVENIWFYYNNVTDKKLDEREIFLLVMEAAPSTTPFLMQYVFYLFSYDDSTPYENLNKELLKKTAGYLDGFLQGDLTTNLQVVCQKIIANNRQAELENVLTVFNIIQTEENDSISENDLLNSYKMMIANQFNTLAWYNYEYAGLDEKILEQSLIWSEASLQIEPESPYYLDTYAHLLYRLGRKAEAVEWQEKAVKNIDKISGLYQQITAKKALIKMKNDTHW